MMNRLFLDSKCLITMLLLVIGVMFTHGVMASPEVKPVIRSAIVIPHVISDEERRTTALLNKAVSHIEKKGRAGLNDFSKLQKFTDRELYVFALDTDGVFLVSGGASLVLIGSNVSQNIDMYGKPFFREMIDKAVSFGHGMVEYHWSNPIDSQGEPKRTLFRLVNNVIIAVGYYPSRAKSYQAKKLLDDAVKALITDEFTALEEFSQYDGRFVEDELYVIVIDMKSGFFLAHGGNSDLVGAHHVAVFDPKGAELLNKMFSEAREKGRGVIVYSWVNPTTGNIETKHTLYRMLDNKLVGVGYYEKPKGTK